MSDARPTDDPDRADGRLAEHGMRIFVVSLAVLFAAALVGYFVIRASATTWRTTRMPRLPMTLWVSTGLLVIVSSVLEAAKRSVAQGAAARASTLLRASILGGIAFLVVQGAIWRRLILVDMPADVESLYAFSFYMLTGLHALHVVGGLVALTFVAMSRRHLMTRPWRVRNCVFYWHFLLVAWLVLWITLQLTS